MNCYKTYFSQFVQHRRYSVFLCTITLVFRTFSKSKTKKSQAEFLKIFRLEANTNIKKDVYNKHMLRSQQDAIQVGGGEDGN